MEENITYMAHKDDLYQIGYLDTGAITKVVVFPESRMKEGTSLTFWSLPETVKEEILEHVQYLLC